MEAQDSFIQKKLLYKFDKKIQTVFQSLFALTESSVSQEKNKMIDQTQENSKKNGYLTKEGILQEIEWLQFQNFKYRTALISAKKDQTSNQQILKKAQQQIIDSKRQVEALSKQLQLSLKSRRNKMEYNQLAESLKSNYEPLAVQKDQLAQITKQIQGLENKYQKEHLQYEKKQRCLRLALSALKSVIDDQTTQTNQSSVSNNELYVPQVSTFGSVQKVSQQFSSQMIQNSQANNSGRQQGEQLEGGQILY